MKMHTIVGLVVVAGACILTGCSAAPDSSSGSPGKTSSEPTYWRTVVRRNADGTETVTQSAITASEQAKQVADANARKAIIASGGFVTDTLANSYSPCATADIWIFSQTNYAGDEICFYNNNSYADYANLTNYYMYPCSPFVCELWSATSVGSYEGGTQAGCFGSTTTLAPPFYCNFTGGPPYDNVPNAHGQSCWSNSEDYIWLNGTCT